MTIERPPFFSPKKRELVELAKFVLNRKTDKIRDELCDFLVAYSLHVKQKTNVSEIVSHIEETYGLPDFPEDRIIDAISRLSEKHEIIKKNQKYLLTEEKVNELTSMTESFEKTREYVQNNLISNIRKKYQKLSNSQTNFIIEALYQLLGTIFTRYGIVCAEAVTGSLPKTMLGFPDFSSLCDDLFESMKNVVLKRVVLEEIRAMFMSPDGKTSNFFYAMAQSYALMEILNLDPGCIKLSEKYLSEKRVYLDTNIIVALLCVADPLHEATVKLVRRTQKLGLGMFFSTRTKSEFIRRLSLARKLFSRFSSTSKTVFEKSSELIEDVFIRSYKTEFKGSTSNWGLFYSQMLNFDGLLKDKFGIREDTKKYEDVRQNPDLEYLSKLVFRASYFTKPEPVSNHDAHHILLIRSFREKEGVSPLGTRYWFLTLDHSLDRVERDFDKEVLQTEVIPSSIHGNAWLEMISPFLHPDIVKSETSFIFSKILSSHFPVVTKALNPYDVADLSGEWMLGLNSKALKRIIGDKFVRETLQRYREAKAKKEEFDISEIITPVAKKLREELKLEVTEDIKTEYEGKISKLEKRLGKLESEEERFTPIRNSLIVLGLISFALIIMLTLIAAYQNFLVPDAVYHVLGTLTVFFIGAAVFGKSVFKLIK